MAYASPYNDPYISQHRRPTDLGAQQPAAAQSSDENFFNPYENSNPYPTYENTGPPAGGEGYGNYGGRGYTDALPPQGVPQRYPTPGGRSQRSQPSMDDSRGQRGYGGAGGYSDQPRRNPTQHSQLGRTQPEKTKEIGFGGDEYAMGGAIPRQQKTARALRQYRTDGHLWKKGGRGGCIGRFLGCGVLMFLLIVPCIFLTFALFIRPPNITIGAVNPSANDITRSPAGLNISMGVNISVSNPNYFGVSFSQISADIIYPINNTDIGGGISRNIDFSPRSQNNFTFPFYIDYQAANDPGGKIILDLATKCGVLGTGKSNIVVNYRLTLGLKILFFTISPVIANQFSFACPLKQSDLQGLVGA